MSITTSKRLGCFLSTCAVLLALAAPAPANAKRIDFGDLRFIIGLSDPQLSPDGRFVALVVSRVNEQANRHDSDIVLVDVASKAQRTLTFERRDVGSPRWSPDGTRLAFIAAAGSGDDAKDQIFVMPMNGGDPVQLTRAAQDVQQFAWRPDGRALAFVVADSPNKAALERHDDAFEVGDNDYTTNEAPLPSHIWLVSSAGGAVRRLTQGTWSISSADGGGAGAPISWSPDGRRIAFVKLPNANSGDSDYAPIAILDVAAKTVREPRRPWASLGGPLYAPNADVLALSWYRHGAFNSNATLAVAPAAGGKGSALTASLDHNVDWYRWSPDGSALFAGMEEGLHSTLWRVPLRGTARRMPLQDIQFGQDADVGRNGAVAFVGHAGWQPDELYYLPGGGAGPRRLTNFNARIAALELGRQREIQWTGPGGYAEDGVLTLPPGFVAGKKYPLALVIHGGPQSASQLGFSELDQLLAARDFLVFSPNYRGSTNLGDAYQHAIYRDTGDGPGKDVMAGLAALERLGIVDVGRVGVSGWSYGGYMTSWLNGHYHVWKAAVEGAALNDWMADYTIAWYQRGDVDFFGGGPWTKAFARMWRDQSPIYTARYVTAPTLIMGDTGDANVPIYNSYEMYHALKDNGVRVEFWAYPVHSHFPDDPVRTGDVYRRWIDWMVRYVKGGS